MLKQYEGAGKTYLSIIDGKLRQVVTQETPGAVKRDWKAPDGSTGTKWELVYNSVSGTISDIRLKDTDYGQFLVVEFDGNESLQLHTDHRYFTDFVKKIAGADISRPVELAPFDFENDEKKRVVGMTVKQDGKKVEDFFYDSQEKKGKNGIPQPEGDKKKYTKDDWKMYFLTVKKFLLAYVVLTIAPKVVKNEEKPVEVAAPPEKATKLADIPF